MILEQKTIIAELLLTSVTSLPRFMKDGIKP